MTPVPKPVKPRRGGKACYDHMDKVAKLPCVCCGKTPVQVHHVIHGRFSQARAGDFETIPLCVDHHRELHAYPAQWKARYGQDRSFLATVTAQIYGAIGEIS